MTKQIVAHLNTNVLSIIKSDPKFNANFANAVAEFVGGSNNDSVEIGTAINGEFNPKGNLVAGSVIAVTDNKEEMKAHLKPQMVKQELSVIFLTHASVGEIKESTSFSNELLDAIDRYENSHKPRKVRGIEGVFVMGKLAPVPVVS